MRNQHIMVFPNDRSPIPGHGDGKFEPYSKRKASPLAKGTQNRKLQARNQSLNENYDTLLGASPKSIDFPQKKQKVITTQYKCDVVGCHKKLENPEDLTFHKRMHGELRRYVTSSGFRKCRPWYSESIASTTTETNSDSESCEPSLTNDSHSSLSSISVPSSRSSSSPPDCEIPVELDAPVDGPSPAGFVDIIETVDSGYYEKIEIFSTFPLHHQSMRVSVDYAIPLDHRMAVPKTDLDANAPELRFIEELSGHSGEPEEYGDEASIMGTDTPSSPSQENESSFSENEPPSTEGDKSSKSHPSSDISDCVPIKENMDNDEANPLKSLFESELTDPEVAEILFQSLAGKLECAAPNPDDHFVEGSDLSLLGLLELQDDCPVQNSGEFTTYAPSSSSSSSGSSSSTAKNQGLTSSSSGQGAASGGSSGIVTGRNQTGQRDDTPGQSTKPRKNAQKTNSQTSKKIHAFRCFHNALDPETFCVNHETQDHFRACAGPGYGSIQHLKDHTKSHHSKKPNSLQCTRCQEEFKTQAQLNRHELNVDCAILCPMCRAEFKMKADRQAHQEECQVGGEKSSKLMEIDDTLWEKIKDELKSYTTSLTKGKKRADPAMDSWIEANTPRYMINREPESNARLELGQWYTIFRILSPNKMLEHPFYDFGLLPSDLAGEKILMINDGLVDAKIQIHGAPPTDLEQQRAWYRDVLRDSLKLAAKTTLVLQNKGGPSSEQQNTSGNPSNTPYLQELPRTGIQSYNMVGVATPPRDPQIPSMGHPLSGMDAITPTFLSQTSGTSAPSSVMTGDMTEPGWGEFPQLLVEEMVHSYEPRYSNYDLSQNYGSGFDQTEPDIMDSQYQHWPMQQGRRQQ